MKQSTIIKSKQEKGSTVLPLTGKVQSVRLTPRQAARRMKQELNRIWPTVTFRMAAANYSIEAYYTDGPTQEQVTEVMQKFSGEVVSVNTTGRLERAIYPAKEVMSGARFYSESFPYECCKDVDLTQFIPNAKGLVGGLAAYLGTSDGYTTTVKDEGVCGSLILTKTRYCAWLIEKLTAAFEPLGYTVLTGMNEGISVIGFLTQAGLDKITEYNNR